MKKNYTPNPDFEAKREQLMKYSAIAREYRSNLAAQLEEQGKGTEAMIALATPLNEYIIELFYKTGDHTEFKSFLNWKDEGRMVCKGQKGFMIWGQPIRATGKTELPHVDGTTEVRENDYKYWPVSYLFSNAQVKEMELIEA